MSEKRIVHEGKEIGKVPNATPGAEIEVATGKQDGNTTFKKYVVESVDNESVKVIEKPLLG